MLLLSNCPLRVYGGFATVQTGDTWSRQPIDKVNRNRSVESHADIIIRIIPGSPRNAPWTILWRRERRAFCDTTIVLYAGWPRRDGKSAKACSPSVRDGFRPVKFVHDSRARVCVCVSRDWGYGDGGRKGKRTMCGWHEITRKHFVAKYLIVYAPRANKISKKRPRKTFQVTRVHADKSSDGMSKNCFGCDSWRVSAKMHAARDARRFLPERLLRVANNDDRSRLSFGITKFPTVRLVHSDTQ